MTPAPPPPTLAILAGGAGSRMGRPKGELRLNGQPILAHLLDRLRWPSPTLLVTAPGREHPPGWELFSREVADPLTGQGPLRGLLTALDASETDRVLLATVDMPEVGRDQLDWLTHALDRTGEALGIFLRAPADARRIEPFPCILRRSAAKLIRARLDAGRLAVHALADEPGFSSLPAPADWPEWTWTNLNRPEDLAAWVDEK